MMPVKARYENNVLKPLEKLDLIEGDEVEIEIIIVNNQTYYTNDLLQESVLSNT
jgi:predicted DNA-binding antitoxin AbrB/MazE fold protein